MTDKKHSNSKRNLKVCHIAATSDGATWMLEQLRELRDLYGYDVSAIISNNQGALADKLKDERIPYFTWDFSFASAKDILGLPRKITGLSRLFHREQFDIVQTHLFHSMVIGRISAWLAGVPVRLSMIAGPYHLESYTARWVDRSTCWLDTAIIASCKYTRMLYRNMGIKDKRIELVYYGPDASKFNPATTKPANIRSEMGWPDNTPLIVMVAYFYPPPPASRWTPPHLWNRAIKGHQYLIEAMPKVLAEFPNARCLLVGSGWGEAGNTYKSKMEQLASSLNLENQIIFAGFRSDINNILLDADVSVQPSLNENLGGTIESLLMQCPTVASRVGGIVDSIKDNETGLLVTPGDSDDLARSIIKILQNPDQAKVLGANGRALMLNQFCLDKTVSDLHNIYNKLYSNTKIPTHSGLLIPLRIIIFLPYAVYLALRFVLFDLILLPKLDAGWRPWNVQTLKTMPYRFYGFLRKIFANTAILRIWDRLLSKIRG